MVVWQYVNKLPPYFNPRKNRVETTRVIYHGIFIILAPGASIKTFYGRNALLARVFVTSLSLTLTLVLYL
jgi:hypothetical protein